MRTENCKQCGSFDWYEKGRFSYCRPCHTEAQKRYLQNKALGISYEHKKPSSRSLEQMLSLGRVGSNREKTHCPQGHPYSGSNVRVEEDKGWLHRKCRTCERNQKRITYGLAPYPDGPKLSDLLDE